MRHDVNPGNVTWVVKRLNEAMGNGQFSSAEVILGVAEFAGRIIVAMADTPVQGMQALNLLAGHMQETAKAGYIAKGYNMSSEEQQ